MTDVARALTAVGWLAGIALIAAGWPLLAALGVLAVAITAAVALRRWGGKLRKAVKARAQVVLAKLTRQPKTGGIVERV
jgi:hypothetical protein